MVNIKVGYSLFDFKHWKFRDENDEISVFEAFERHQVFNDANALDTAKVEGNSEKKTIMNNALIVIRDGNKVQNAGGVTDSETIKKMKKAMAQTITDYVEGAVILANAANKSALADNIYKSFSSINGASKANAVSWTKEVRKLFFDNAIIITNVKAANFLWAFLYPHCFKESKKNTEHWTMETQRNTEVMNENKYREQWEPQAVNWLLKSVRWK